MAKETKKQQIYETLKEQIIRCELQPGTFITEDELAQQTGYSRTPIREALQKLEEDELVQIGSKKGILIQPITAKQIRNYFDLRKLVEPYCVLNFGNRIPMDTLQEYLDTLRLYKKDGEYRKAEELDQPLHMAIIRASNNDYLIKVMEKLFLYGLRIRYFSKTSEEYASPALDQHIRILEYILFGEYEKASDEMLRHVKGTEITSYSLVFGDTASLNELNTKIKNM